MRTMPRTTIGIDGAPVRGNDVPSGACALALSTATLVEVT